MSANSHELIALNNFPTVEEIRNDFPILSTIVHGNPLIYLDNAATSQKPIQVIEAIDHYYKYENANIHRGVHYLSATATEAYEACRVKVRDFINARSLSEVIFTSGTTDSINLVASSFSRKFLKKGGKVLISALEHHSNIVPWQLACEQYEAELVVIPMNHTGELVIEEFYKLLDESVCLVAISHISNSLGTINPVKEMIDAAHALNIPVLLDGAQSIAHQTIDVQDLDCDFFTFSAHKILGPTGFGVLYGKEKLLEVMPPWKGGGEMIKTVSFTKTTYNELPFKFEAGTPHIAGGIGLSAAITYLMNLGMDNIEKAEQVLLEKSTYALSKIEGVELIGTSANKASIVSFNVKGVHPYDVGVILDQLGIAVRTGHHCTQPIMDFLGIPGTVRASFCFYNSEEEIYRLEKGIRKAITMLT